MLANISIVDPAARDPVRKATIVVNEGRITAIGRSPRRPPGARIIDGRGTFVVPGLWDMHAHLAALTPIGLAPERYVGYGVLGVRDMGGLADSLLPLKARILAGKRIGPDIVLAGPTLNGEQSADFHRQVVTDAETRKAVRDLKTLGVDFIKIHRAIGREAFAAIADETRRLGLPFSGHVPLAMSWIEGSSGGMRTIEHIQTMYENEQPDPARLSEQFADIADRLGGAYGDSIFAVLVHNGTFFDPTLVGYETSIARAASELAACRRAAFRRMKTLAAHAARSGVRLLAGTDVLERHGEMLLIELERLVEIGLTPQQALAAATTTAADAVQRRGRMGTSRRRSGIVSRARCKPARRHNASARAACRGLARPVDRCRGTGPLARWRRCSEVTSARLKLRAASRAFVSEPRL